MEYRISTDPADVQVERVHRALAATYWSPGIRRDVVERAIANSVVVGAFATATGEQVAFARAVTDRATFAWVCDVHVDEPHRGRGLAKLMLAALHAHPDLQTLRRWCLATRDAHGLYAKLGYGGVKAANWMERRMPATAWEGGEGAG